MDKQLTLPGCSWASSAPPASRSPLRVVDLFCGAGGFSEGFRQAGHEIVLAIDWDEDALKSHEANHPGAEHWLEDIRRIGALPSADVVIGSPPCIPLSRGNPRRDFDISLCMDFLRLALTARPTFFVMENVPDAAYRVPLRGVTLDATDFGVPQHRVRWFGGMFPPPSRTRSCPRPSVHDVTGRVLRVRLRNGFEQRIDSARPAPTVVAHWAKRGKAVPFSVDELKSLMGFPHNYQFAGAKSSQVRQIGNAVPPPIAKAFGLSMRAKDSSLRAPRLTALGRSTTRDYG